MTKCSFKDLSWDATGLAVMVGQGHWDLRLWSLDDQCSSGCFRIVVLEKTLESPLDSKEWNQSILKEINPEYSLKDWYWSSKSFGHLVDLKISHRLKAERVLFSEKILGLQAWETTSQGALRDCCEEAGEGVRLYTSLQQRGQAVWTSKITVNKKNQTSS